VKSNIQKICSKIVIGNDVVLFTSRQFIAGLSSEQGQLVRSVLTDIVRGVYMCVRPSYIVAKGGVTSHEVAVSGLGMSRARVLGQIETGVPVWEPAGDALDTTTTSTSSGMSKKLRYIVFPGNVGDDQTLVTVLSRLGVMPKNPQIVVTQTAVDVTTASTEVASLLSHYLSLAQKQQASLAAFDVYSLEGAKAVVAAAEMQKSPVILQVNPRSLDFGGMPLLDMLLAFKQHASVPVFVHLDHLVNNKHIEMALKRSSSSVINGGVDSIMVDGSELPFEDNLKWTQEMVRLIHSSGVWTEATLEMDGQQRQWDPEQIAFFVKETNVDSLVVNFDSWMQWNNNTDNGGQIRQLIGIGGMPFAMNEVTNLSSEWIQRVTEGGVCKVHVGEDVMKAAVEFYRREWSRIDKGTKNTSMVLLPLLTGSCDAMQRIAEKKIAMLNPNNFKWGLEI